MWSHILLEFPSNHFMPASTPVEVWSVTVFSCFYVIPVLPDMLTGIRDSQQQQRGGWRAKSYASRCHVGFFCTFLHKSNRDLGSVVDLFCSSWCLTWKSVTSIKSVKCPLVNWLIFCTSTEWLMTNNSGQDQIWHITDIFSAELSFKSIINSIWDK